MEVLKFAAIDIGSNAIRLLFSNVIVDKKPKFKKVDLVRVPIRLGEDVFSKNKISSEKEERLIKSMHAFKHLIEVHEVISYRACATSAMRDSSNGKEIVDRIKKETGIQINIIGGKKEAEIIHDTHTAEEIKKYGTFLYIDVGGGSTEMTLFHNNRAAESQSFNIGAVRVLKGLDKESEWKRMSKWMSKIEERYDIEAAIGSGGNINKLFKMTGKKEGTPLRFERLNQLFKELANRTINQRIVEYGLNTDRADVIVPAARIFITIMNSLNISKIYVPKIGVSDGLIHEQYEEYKAANEIV